MSSWLYALLVVLGVAMPPTKPETTPSPPPSNELDRIAAAVEGAESSHGTNPAMWRPSVVGPQGPMQVTAAAAADVRDGDRFDLNENRRIGRDYLALLYRRYGSWTDAVIAYNWGPGNFERWTATGRKIGDLSVPLKAYVERIMRAFLARSRGDAVPLPADPARGAPSLSEDPPAVEIRDPARRKTYLADRDAIAQLRSFLGEAQPGQPSVDARTARALIRRVALRSGYEEFALSGPRQPAGPPMEGALREIAKVLIEKLRSECGAIVLIDRQRRSAAAR